MKSQITRSILRLLVVVAVSAGAARAQPASCTAINQVPYTINAPGLYCKEKGFKTLAGDLTTSISTGSAITIASSNVVLDLGGFSLRYLANGEVSGIYALDQNNLTIRNGTVVGFFRAIFLQLGGLRTSSSRGHIVEHIRAEQSKARGIEIDGGVGSVVRHNHIHYTGGSNLFPSSIGILMRGVAHRVLNNDVIDAVGTNTYGIAAGAILQLGSAHDIVIEFNRISRVKFGISAGFPAMIVGNRVIATGTGITTNSPPGLFILKDNVIHAPEFYESGTGNYTDGGGNYPSLTPPCPPAQP